MIPERNTTEVTSTIDGRDVAMTIDQSALAHIMNVLTDLYEDPELAVLREYSTNAFDSHVEAGQSRPIEVSLPTELCPLLTIRDYGVGLDSEDIESIYSRYGASTKRDTNDAVGMLGLGCKSALAYVDQFTLVGIKNGARIAVSISRDEQGAGVMTILEQGETEEPNGVEVVVPAKRFHSFEEKAAEFFRYWEPGTVLVNGEEPAPLKGWRIDDEFMIADKDRYDRRLRIVMGNVSYPISYDYEAESAALQSLPDDKQIIARVPIGMVTFTPSREALQDHPATRAALDQILATFRTACEHAIKTQIAGAADKPAAARTLLEARAALGPKNVPPALFGGEAIPTVISAEDMPTGSKFWTNKPVRGYRGGISYKVPARQISLDEAARWPWILGFNNQTWTSSMRSKFLRYLEHHKLIDPDVEDRDVRIYITDAEAVPKPEWIDGAVTAVPWSKVREWKDPIKKSEGGAGGEKYAGTYGTYYPRGKGESGHFHQKKYEADKLPKDSRMLFYVIGDQWEAHNLTEILGNRATVVYLTSTREAKFKRLFPHAREAREIARKAARSWWEAQSTKRQLACTLEPIYEVHERAIASLPADKIEDSELAYWVQVLQLSENARLAKKFEQYVHYLPTAAGDFKKQREDCARTINRYPLISNLYNMEDKKLQHAVTYVNAVYEEEN